MKSARVSIGHDVAALSSIHAGICSSPDIDREIVLGGQTVDGVETITSFVYGDAAAYEALLEDREAVQEYDVTETTDGFFLYLRRVLGSRERSLLDALAGDTVVVVPPIEVRSDRTIRLTIVGHPTDLASVLGNVPDGVTVDVLWVSDSVSVAGTPASDRQLAALRAAWDVGYYDVPRRNGIEAVADELDCAVSTASELLRRAEANVVGRALDRQ